MTEMCIESVIFVQCDSLHLFMHEKEDGKNSFHSFLILGSFKAKQTGEKWHTFILATKSAR